MILDQIRQEITKERERVVYLYNRSQISVDSDKELLNEYQNTFGDIKELNIVATIKRVGRDLRRKHPNRFRRTEQKLEFDEKVRHINLAALGYN